jgi:hypothetical protein
METVCSFEMSVTTYESVGRQNPEHHHHDCHVRHGNSLLFTHSKPCYILCGVVCSS